MQVRVRQRKRPVLNAPADLAPIVFSIGVSHRTPSNTILRVKYEGFEHTGAKPVPAFALMLAEAGIDENRPFHMRWEGSDFDGMRWGKLKHMADRGRKNREALEKAFGGKS